MAQCRAGPRAGTLQWDKLRKAGTLAHLARWFDHVAAEPALAEVAERHGPKRPRPAAEAREAASASGRPARGAPGSTKPALLSALGTTCRAVRLLAVSMRLHHFQAERAVVHAVCRQCPCALQHLKVISLHLCIHSFIVFKRDMYNKE